MIPARVLARDLSTGRIFQAMRGERGDTRRWRWIEVTHDDKPVLDGDVIFSFPTQEAFPLHAPDQSNAVPPG